MCMGLECCVADREAEHLVGTRARLVEVAGEEFARRGFADATVRAICERAGVNIAAVNYHFGDKAGLYRACVQSKYEKSLAHRPPEGGLGPERPAEERLGVFIATMLERMLDSSEPAWLARIMAREMVQPTDVFDEMCDHFIRPQFAMLRGIVAEIIGAPVESVAAYRAAYSVVGQCLFYKHCRGVVERITPGQGYDRAAVAGIAEHVTRLSLAGLRAMREAGADGAAGDAWASAKARFFGGDGRGMS